MKTIKQTLMSGAMMLALSLMFTSCDELIGELDNLAPSPVAPSKAAGTISYAETSFLKGSLDPAFTNALTLTGDGAVSYESSNSAVATVDATGKVTFTGTAGTTTIKAKVSDSDAYTYATNEASYTLEVLDGYSFMEWDDTAQKLVSAIETDYQEVTSGASSFDPSKVLVVKDADVSITTNITLSGNTKIILCDGAKLTTKEIFGSTNRYTLTIYGQDAQTGQLITQPSGDDHGITMIGELNIHGGDISANGTTGVKLEGGSQTLNVYGGKLTARGSSVDGIYGCKALNILGGTVEAYGGTFSTGFGQMGIDMYSFSDIITVSNDGRLKAQGADGTTGDGGNGIYGTLVAKDNAVVEVYGGHATSGNQWGGSAIIGGDVEIRDNARITCVAGNSKGAKDGVNAIPNNVYYYGGTLIAIGGAKGDSDHNDGNGIGGTLTNSSGGTIYYATNSDGSDETFPTIVTMLSSDPAKDFTSSAYRGIKVYK